MPQITFRLFKALSRAVRRPNRLTGLAFLAFLMTSVAPAAGVANAPPLGGLRYTINSGSVTAPVTTSFAIPLFDIAAAQGARVGRITGMTATSITSNGANWTAGALAMPAFPYVFQITSGPAAGTLFSITANTADTLLTSGVNLTSAGIGAESAGDTFRLIPIDTLKTAFGTNTFLGGTNPSEADIIILGSSTQLAYYFNTTLACWVRTTGPTIDRGNIPIPPNGMVSVTRKSNALTLTLVGRVPDVRFSVAVPNSGSTYTHTGFPTDVTLGTLSLQTALPGWVSASTAADADTLAVSSGALWLTYFHNGSNWQRTTGPAINRDPIIITSGTPILIFKHGVAAGTSLFSRNLPYPL